MFSRTPVVCSPLFSRLDRCDLTLIVAVDDHYRYRCRSNKPVQLPSASSIKLFLKPRLPPYAVPHVCILLDAIPINMASGKADKKKLPKSGHAEVSLVDGRPAKL